jgi:uncharacterized membrane protein
VKQNNSKITIVTNVLLALFIFLSVFVKFYQLDSRSFFLDELYSVSAALEKNYHYFLENWVYCDANPPLYYFFLRFWLKLFPATEFWIRLPSAIFSVLGIVYFVMGIKKRFHSSVWFYLMLFTGCSYGFLFFGQEARSYAMLLFFTCIQMLSFIDLIRVEASKSIFFSLFVFTLTSVFSSFTNYTGFLFSGLLFVILFIFHRKNGVLMKYFSISILTLLLLNGLWLKNYLFIWNINKSYIVHQGYSIIRNLVAMIFFGYSFFAKLVALIFLVFISFSTVVSWKRIRDVSNDVKDIIFLGVFLFFFIFLSVINLFLFSYRHYIVLLPSILLMISFLCTFNAAYVQIKKIIFLVFGIIVLLSQLFTHNKSQREEWRKTVSFIVGLNGNEKSNVLIIGEPWDQSNSSFLKDDPKNINLSKRRKIFYDYYFSRLDSAKDLNLVQQKPDSAALDKYVSEDLITHNKVFVLSYIGNFPDKIRFSNSKFCVYQKDFYGHVLYQITSK